MSLGSFLTAFIGDARFSTAVACASLRSCALALVSKSFRLGLSRNACHRNRCDEHPMMICALISLSTLANSQVLASFLRRV